ncbi:MAG: tRNA(Ile)-lysidine synthetase, partial [Frankiales bacterium]|nr:tRNA(Ile)-lysidine synthetase [Frankiales bacterium]
MTGPPAATAAVRVAVRRALADEAVAAAVSGGADSLALAAALAFERPGSYALIVDHGLQPGSAQVAGRAAEQCRSLGLLAEVLTAPSCASCAPSHDRRQQGAVDPPEPAGPAGAGPEGRARALRYAALDAAADRLGLEAVLLGHTRDDQAETVL